MLRLFPLIAIIILLAACRPAAPPVAPSAPGWLSPVGLPFRHASGASGQFLMPEIMGSGVALLDYDNDGDLDIFLLQGHPSAGSNTLLRNDDGRFSDATAAAGLTRSNYGMGAATADIDNDGDTDLLVTAFDGNRLYRNNGNATFSDITPPALQLPGLWSTSASFFDYDNDGLPDLAVGIYIDYSFATNKPCRAPTGEPDYCTPRAYRSLHSRLFHNERGTFVDVTAKSGFDKAAGPALGLVAFDANADGFLDLFVANDSSANHLWINNKNGTFSEQALALGLAYAENGLAKAGMGVSLGDYDNDGDEDLIVLNLMREGATLFENNGPAGFSDVSARTAIHNLTFQFTGFGAGWADFDRDGRLDLFLANGAVTRREEQRGQPEPFRERNLLLRQVPNGRFEAVPDPSLDKPAIHRAAAFGDIDNDGDVDVIVNVNNGPALLYKNSAPPKNWLTVAAPAGARVELVSPGLPRQIRYARTDSSYLAANDPRVHFAAGAAIESVTVQLPGRPARVLRDVKPNTVLRP